MGKSTISTGPFGHGFNSKLLVYQRDPEGKVPFVLLPMGQGPSVQVLGPPPSAALEIAQGLIGGFSGNPTTCCVTILAEPVRTNTFTFLKHQRFGFNKICQTTKENNHEKSQKITKINPESQSNTMNSTWKNEMQWTSLKKRPWTRWN